MSILQELEQKVKEGNAAKAKELTQQALDQGLGYTEIMNQGLIKGMTEIGELFGRGEVYMPEVIMSARAMTASLDLILPILSSSNFDYIGQFAIGTVKDDIHNIGKNIVAAVFSGSGFKVTDLGVDVPPEKFIEAVEQGAQLLGMSALIGPTMPNMKVTIEALEKAGVRSRVKVIIGGALVTEEFAKKIGADASAKDAFDGVRKARELLGV